MIIKVLGCSGAEIPDQNMPAFLIDGKLLLDAGTIGAVLAEGEQVKIRNILITHAHLDHIKGLPFFADTMAQSRKKHNVKVLSHARVIQAMKNSLFNGVIWPDFTKIPSPTNAVINFQQLKPGKTTRIDGYSVTAYMVDHAVPAVAYLLEDRKGRRLLYTGDSGPTEVIWNAVNDIVIHGLIIEVSLPNRLKELALTTGHLTPRMLQAELAKLDTPPERIFVSHFKHRYENKIKEELDDLGIENIEILEDGDLIEL